MFGPIKVINPIMLYYNAIVVRRSNADFMIPASY